MLSKVLSVKFLALFLTASVKFAFGVPAALLYYHFNFFEGFIFAFSAGFFGVWFWLYLSKFLFKAIDYFEDRYRGSHPKPPKKRFTPSSRRFVKLKMKYGLIGIAIITPAIISIPVGTLVAMRIYKHDRRHVLLYLTASVAAWSVLFSAIITVFHASVSLF